MSKVPRPIVIDMETYAIEKRPHYPPTPVGVSIKWPNERKPYYYAWGHVTGGNNCDLATAKAAIKDVWAATAPVLFHNCKFDMAVAEEKLGMPPLPWRRTHDTQFLLFLLYPHDQAHSLKPAAHKYLGLAPEERDAVFDWLRDHQRELIADGHLPEKTRITVNNAGAYISLAPANIVGPYANGDVTRTLGLYDALYPVVLERGMGEAYDRERRLVRPLADNERQGLDTDNDALERDTPLYEKEYLKAEALLRKKLKAPDLDFNKDAQVGEALLEAGVVREWTKTPSGKLSVSSKNLTHDKWEDPSVFHLLGYRNKLETCLVNYMRPWLAAGGRVHPGWIQTRGGDGGARTGRLAGSPNFMATAKDFTDKGDGWVCPPKLKTLPLVRRYLLPDKMPRSKKRMLWGRRDYNQQELRILAHFEDGALLQAYLNNPNLDVHKFVQDYCTSELGYDVPRTPIKTLNFGIIYGQGVPSMAAKLQRSVDEIKLLRALQFKLLEGLPELQKAIRQLSKGGEPITTWGGRQYYVEPSKLINGRMVDFTYKLLNYLIQGSAADCTKEAVCRWYEAGYGDARFLLTVHDEINMCAPDKAFKHEMLRLREIMTSVEFDVPMISDGEYGPNWADMTDLVEPKPDLSQWKMAA